MDPARFESLCFVYIGALFTGAAALFTWTQSDLTWLAIFGTGPLFLVAGLYRLRNLDRLRNPPTEFGTRIYSLVILSALATVVVAFQLYAHFG
ncbi:hypothetical protein [Salinibaculum salinum]|uniref:hypothetical protein n=1 Tax=Salinibaculum salinum TaxID=3131996 RepID=UPI0030EB4407